MISPRSKESKGFKAVTKPAMPAIVAPVPLRKVRRVTWRLLELGVVNGSAIRRFQIADEEKLPPSLGNEALPGFLEWQNEDCEDRDTECRSVWFVGLETGPSARFDGHGRLLSNRDGRFHDSEHRGRRRCARESRFHRHV